MLAERLGIGRQAISNAVADGQFPASWYLIVKKECDQRDLACPRELFRFKTDPLKIEVHIYNQTENAA